MLLNPFRPIDVDLFTGTQSSASIEAANGINTAMKNSDSKR